MLSFICCWIITLLLAKLYVTKKELDSPLTSNAAIIVLSGIISTILSIIQALIKLLVEVIL